MLLLKVHGGLDIGSIYIGGEHSEVRPMLLKCIAQVAISMVVESGVSGGGRRYMASAMLRGRSG